MAAVPYRHRHHHPITPGSQRPSGLWLPRVDRRAFLLGSAGVVVLAACGDDGGEDTAATVADATTTTVDTSIVNLGQLFDTSPGYTLVGQEQRFTFGLFDYQGAPLAEQPAELTFALGHATDGEDFEATGEPYVATKYGEGLPRPYFSFRATLDTEGIWYARTTVDGQELLAPFEVSPAGTPGVVPIGDEMPEVPTPTLTDDLGVDPICTRDPQCPFHAASFEDARIGGTPIVLCVSTPAYCQVAICGPVLDLVVDASAEYPDFAFVHAEPWKAPVPGDPFTGGVAPAMEALGLNFEPALFLVGADGVLVDRLDNLWDSVELHAALDNLSA